MTTKRFRQFVRMLRKHSIIRAWVSVRRRPMKKLCGQVTFNGTDYMITISSTLDSQAQIETLMHEWAHVLAIEEAYGHGKPWSEMYSHVYEFVDQHWIEGKT